MRLRTRKIASLKATTMRAHGLGGSYVMVLPHSLRPPPREVPRILGAGTPDNEPAPRFFALAENVSCISKL